MLREKIFAAESLARVGLIGLYGRAKSRVVRELVLLGYHRILPLARDSEHIGDAELISATPSDFAWQVDYLSRRFEPVTFEQLADCLENRIPFPRRAMAITFDDGFSDVYDHAFEILRRADMPATVFVSTDYVGQRRPFWFDLVAWLVSKAPMGSVRIPSEAMPLPLDDSETARRAAVVKVLKWLKSCDEHERQVAVDDLCARFPEAASAGETVLGHALSWEQIREMSDSRIEFGSHTASHCCLSKVGAAQLERELLDSKRALEDAIDKPVVSLAYPFGGKSAFNDTVIAAARRLGYRIATTYIPGVNRRGSADPFALRRQHIERYTGRRYFEALVNAAEFFD